MEMKSEKFQNIALGVLFVAVISLTIAYALMSQQLNITASGTVTNKTASWNVHFTNLSCGVENTHAEITTPASITGNTAITGLAFKLKAPGDKVKCTFDVENTGLLDARLDTYSPLSGTCSDDLITPLNYSIVYASSETESGYAGRAPATDDTLAHGTTRSFVMTVEYASTATYLPATDVSISDISSYFIYEQA